MYHCILQHSDGDSRKYDNVQLSPAFTCWHQVRSLAARILLEVRTPCSTSIVQQSSVAIYGSLFSCSKRTDAIHLLRYGPFYRDELLNHCGSESIRNRIGRTLRNISPRPLFGSSYNAGSTSIIPDPRPAQAVPVPRGSENVEVLPADGKC